MNTRAAALTGRSLRRTPSPMRLVGGPDGPPDAGASGDGADHDPVLAGDHEPRCPVDGATVVRGPPGWCRLDERAAADGRVDDGIARARLPADRAPTAAAESRSGDFANGRVYHRSRDAADSTRGGRMFQPKQRVTVDLSGLVIQGVSFS